MSLSSSRSWLLAGLAVAWPVTVHAAPPPSAPSQEQVESARAPFHEARELHRQGRLNDAVARMLDAYRLAPTPVIACEAGRLLVEAGRLIEGRTILRGVAGLPVSPRESDAGREARREAAALAVQLDDRIPEVTLVGRPAGVDVWLDGKPFAPGGPAAAQGVDPGAHAIVVRAGAGICKSIALTLAERETRSLDLRDVAPPCPPPDAADAPRPPDGGAGGASPPRLRSGALGSDEAPTAPSPAPAAWRWTGVGLAGAGLAAIAAGLYVMLHAKEDYDSVSAECPARGCSVDAYDVRLDAHGRANGASIVMALGATAVAGGGAIWLLLGRSPPDGGARPRIGLGPSSMTLVVPMP
jgi:hypothetical protein